MSLVRLCEVLLKKVFTNEGWRLHKIVYYCIIAEPYPVWIHAHTSHVDIRRHVASSRCQVRSMARALDTEWNEPCYYEEDFHFSSVYGANTAFTWTNKVSVYRKEFTVWNSKSYSFYNTFTFLNFWAL